MFFRNFSDFFDIFPIFSEKISNNEKISFFRNKDINHFLKNCVTALRVVCDIQYVLIASTLFYRVYRV